MPGLVVSLDAVAALRESRRGAEPDPAVAGAVAELAGAGALSLGLRTDRRTGQERDAKVLRAVSRTRLHLRVAPTPDALKVVAPIRPDVVVLGPERPDALAQEGYDLALGGGALGEAVGTLREAGLDALVAIEPDPEHVKAAHRLGVAGIAVSTTRLALARLPDAEARELEAVERCVKLAARLGLVAQAGGGLPLALLPRLARLEGLRWVEVGHALVARAVVVGLDRAVRDARALLA